MPTRRQKGKTSFAARAKALKKQKNAQVLSERRKADVKRRVDRERTLKESTRSARRCFASKKRVLLVGEADFSFAQSVAETYMTDLLEEQRTVLVATSLDDPNTISSKYPKVGLSCVEKCVELGVRVLHGVDATKLDACEELLDLVVAHSTEDDDDTCGFFDRILFVFPHLGSGVADKTQQRMEHQELLRAFFTGCIGLLAPRGEVHVVLKKGAPYDGWRVSKLAVDTGLLRSKAKREFDPRSFPRYSHRKTKGLAAEISVSASETETDGSGKKKRRKEEEDAPLDRAGAFAHVFDLLIEEESDAEDDGESEIE